MNQHWQEEGTRTSGAVWDAAQVLGHYLDQQHERWRNRSSLELGAGLAYASIVASRCGFSSVLATDGERPIVQRARDNARDNARKDDAAVRVEHLLWNDTAALDALLPPGSPSPDLIMASDVIYIGSTESWGAFLQMVARLCRRRREEMRLSEAPARSPPLTLMTWHDGSVSASGDPIVLLSHTRRCASKPSCLTLAPRTAPLAPRLSHRASHHPTAHAIESHDARLSALARQMPRRRRTSFERRAGSASVWSSCPRAPCTTTTRAAAVSSTSCAIKVSARRAGNARERC